MSFIIGFVFGFILTEAVVLWYFFVYKSSLADKEYERRVKEIYERGY